MPSALTKKALNSRTTYWLHSDGTLIINTAATESDQAKATELCDLYKLNRTELRIARQDKIEFPTRSPRRFRFVDHSLALLAPETPNLHQANEPRVPLNGPTTSGVTQPP